MKFRPFFSDWFKNFHNKNESLADIHNSTDPTDFANHLLAIDWFLSVLEQKRLENHEVYYIGAAELP